MSLQSDPTLYKNSLYKMTEPKPIFWAKPCPAQNDGLCRARALPFCAGNFKGDMYIYIYNYNMYIESRMRKNGVQDQCLSLSNHNGHFQG